MMAYKRFRISWVSFDSQHERTDQEVSFPYLIASLMGANEPFLPFTSGR